MSKKNENYLNHLKNDEAAKIKMQTEWCYRWRDKNREAYNKGHREYYEKNKKKHIELVKESRSKRKEHYNEYQREYMREYRKRKKAERNGL